jgi:presenilin-like A22 family membrane protease
MKAKITPNMISFVTVRRGEWIMKISVYKTKHVLVVAQHAYDREIVLIRYFVSESTAADFIEQLASE